MKALLFLALASTTSVFAAQITTVTEFDFGNRFYDGQRGRPRTLRPMHLKMTYFIPGNLSSPTVIPALPAPASCHPSWNVGCVPREARLEYKRDDFFVRVDLVDSLTQTLLESTTKALVLRVGRFTQMTFIDNLPKVVFTLGQEGLTQGLSLSLARFRNLHVLTTENNTIDYVSFERKSLETTIVQRIFVSPRTSLGERGATHDRLSERLVEFLE